MQGVRPLTGTCFVHLWAHGNIKDPNQIAACLEAGGDAYIENAAGYRPVAWRLRVSPQANRHNVLTHEITYLRHFVG